MCVLIQNYTKWEHKDEQQQQKDTVNKCLKS